MSEGEPDYDLVWAHAYRTYGAQVQHPQRDIVVSNVRRIDGDLYGDVVIRLHTPVEYINVNFSMIPPEETHE